MLNATVLLCNILRAKLNCLQAKSNIVREIFLCDMRLTILYCIVLYCIMRPYTDGPIGPLSYRHSSGVVRNPHSTLAE